MADLDYVYLVGRLGLVVGDTSDSGEDPDTTWCDEGTVNFTPKITYTKVVGGSPAPWAGGNSVIDTTLSDEGAVTRNGVRRVKLVDLTSDKVNPHVSDGRATHSVEFVNVKANGTRVSFEKQDIRIAADTAEALPADVAEFYGLPAGTMACDLTKLLPVPTGNGTPIVVGPKGTSIETLTVEGGDLIVELDDGSTQNAGTLPVGPGGSPAGIAAALNDSAGPAGQALAANIASATTGKQDVATLNTDVAARVAGAGATRDAVDARAGAIVPSLVPPAVANVLSTTPSVVDAINAAAAGLDFVTKPQFVPDATADNTVFGFPNNTRSTGSSLVEQAAVNPTGYAAGTDLNGKTSTAGSKTITTRAASGTGAVITSDGTRMGPSGGTQTPVLMSVDVGSPFGTSRLVLGPLAAPASVHGQGPFIGFSISGSTIHYLRVSMSGTSRAYLVHKTDSTTGYAGLAGTVLITTAVVAQLGDVVDLSLRADGRVALTVNGTEIGSYTLTGPELAIYGSSSSTIAGAWFNPTISTGKLAGKWSFLQPVTATETRRMVTIGPDNVLPRPVRDRLPGAVFDIRDYGAKVDGIYLRDAVTTAGAATVSSVARPFTSADVGKTIAVMGAGPVVANANDGVWISTIASVTSGVATLGSNATASVSGARCIFGTPDDAAFAAAQTAAVAAGGGTVYFPQGRTIATLPLNALSYVNWRGAGREVAWVHVIADRAGNGAVAGTADWLTCSGRSPSTPLIGAHFFDFAIEAEAMIHTAGYGSAIKPLNIYYVQRCSIQRMLIRNTPATSIPFDHSYDQCLIAHNYILNPGRLAPSGVGPGGSGIGAGTKGVGATEPTLIHDNVIVGSQTAAAAGPGHNGIFTEGQEGADPDLGTNGYKIVNNTVIGMPYGISDTGSTGTLIDGNTIVGCGRGVSLRKTSLADAYPGLHAIIVNNTIRGCTGPLDTDGIGISIVDSGTSPQGAIRDYLHTIIANNQIIENKSWGIAVSAVASAGRHFTGVTIRGNQIRSNGSSGIRLSSSGGGKLRYFAITDNQIVGNGKRAVSGEQAAIIMPAGTVLEGGRIQDNDMYDLAGTPTQLDRIVSTGATLTAVRVQGNTGDALVTA